MTRVAVLGTGIMGAGMARSLARAGLDVAAWNRNPDKWEDYSALDVRADDLLGNVLRAGAWLTDGAMTDWWEAADRAEFDRRAQALIDQYSSLSPAALPDHKVNGALTVGENIGDLGGLTIALKAYKIALGDAEAPEIDGLTGYQRVFFGWAQIWRIVTREAEAIRRLTIDPHSPPDLRCNAVVTNLDAFHEAFDVHPDDALYTAPEHRVRIW